MLVKLNLHYRDYRGRYCWLSVILWFMFMQSTVFARRRRRYRRNIVAVIRSSVWTRWLRAWYQRQLILKDLFILEFSIKIKTLEVRFKVPALLNEGHVCFYRETRFKSVCLPACLPVTLSVCLSISFTLIKCQLFARFKVRNSKSLIDLRAEY